MTVTSPSSNSSNQDFPPYVSKNSQPIRVSAAGSIMLMGEHAVLFGEQAIACAVDKYIHVTLTPAAGDSVVIESTLANYQSTLSQLADEPKMAFVIAAIRQVADKLPQGFILSITSEFSHTIGLGSSAAVTAATVAVLSAYAGLSVAPEAIFTRALAVVHDVQDGRGSGTDLAASIYGGMVSYRISSHNTQRNIHKLSVTDTLPALSLYYAGYKTTTPAVLKIVESKAQQQPAIYRHIYQLMGQTSEAAATAIKCSDWQQLGELMNIYHGLMDALGVSDHALSDIVYRLRRVSGVSGAKISGSGLGDCVLALGDAAVLHGSQYDTQHDTQHEQLHALANDYQHIAIGIAPIGLDWHR